MPTDRREQAREWQRVTEALRGSQGPAWIARGLLKSATLRTLWPKLPEALRRNIGLFPELLAFLLPTDSKGRPAAPALGWIDARTQGERLADVRKVTESAAALVEAMSKCGPLAGLRLSQLFPSNHHDVCLTLAAFRAADAIDGVREMAAALERQLIDSPPVAVVERPNAHGAAELALRRRVYELLGSFGPWSTDAVRHELKEELAGILSTKPDSR